MKRSPNGGLFYFPTCRELFYFCGIFFSALSSTFHVLPTDAISTTSFGECGPFIFGPNDTASIFGKVSEKIPHSNPA